MNIDCACHCDGIRLPAAIESGQVIVSHCTDLPDVVQLRFSGAVEEPFVVTGDRPAVCVNTSGSGSQREQTFARCFDLALAGDRS